MTGQDDKAVYAPLDPTQAGLKAVCPRCGSGRMFAGMLRFRDKCGNCGLDYGRFEVGDGAVVPVLMAVNAIVLGAALAFHSAFNPPVWLHVLIWPVVITALCIWFTRLMKGLLLAHQYAKDAAQGQLASGTDGSE